MSKKNMGLVIGVVACLFAAGMSSTRVYAAIERDKPAVPAVEPAAKTTVAAPVDSPTSDFGLSIDPDGNH